MVRKPRFVEQQDGRRPHSARAAATLLPAGPPPTTMISASWVATRSRSPGMADGRHAEQGMGGESGPDDAGLVEQRGQLPRRVGAPYGEGHVVAGEAIAGGEARRGQAATYAGPLRRMSLTMKPVLARRSISRRTSTACGGGK